MTLNDLNKTEIAEYLNVLLNIAKEKSDKCYNIWFKLYDYVFSTEISQIIYNKFPDFAWSGAEDFSYKNNVIDFITEFEKYSKIKDTGPLFPTVDEFMNGHQNKII